MRAQRRAIPAAIDCRENRRPHHRQENGREDRMHKNYGKFCWYELMTTDVPAPERSCADVVGWSMRDSGMEGMKYILAYAGDAQAAGICEIPAEAEGMPPVWTGYIFTDRIEAT